MQNRHLSNKEIKETLVNGWHLFKQDKTVLAYDQFEKILNAAESRKYPEIWAEAMAGIGMIFKKRKRFREAKTCFKKAHEKNSRNIMYLIEYGDACKGMRWHSEAIAAWEKCLEYEKNDIRLLTRIAESYDLLGNFVMAKKYYLKSCEIEPKNKHVLMGLGYLYFHNHLYLDAIYYWEKLVSDIHFTDSEIYSKLGHCYKKRKEYDKAIEYFNKALAINEKSIYALCGLLKIYSKLGDKKNESIYYEKLSNTDPKYKDLIMVLAGHYKKEKLYEDLMKRFDEIAKIKGLDLALFDIAFKEKEKGNTPGYVSILEYLYYSSKTEVELKKKVFEELSKEHKDLSGNGNQTT